MFSLLGLRSSPFWTSSHSPPLIAYSDPTVSKVVSTLEGSWEGIRDEYQRSLKGVDGDWAQEDEDKEEGEPTTGGLGDVVWCCSAYARKRSSSGATIASPL